MGPDASATDRAQRTEEAERPPRRDERDAPRPERRIQALL